MKVLAAVAFSEIVSDDGVERTTTGAPIAFRIWKAGANRTDYGEHLFTEKSSLALIEQQARRGNLFSIDIDHLSLDKEAPPESHKAVGWHRIEVRKGDGGPELWAIDVEWTPTVKAGLESKPPEWRYFSPAYDVDKETGEIVGYLNTALTNNPATHFVTQLASARFAATREKSKMDYAAIAAAMFGDDEEKKEEARAALAAMSDDDRMKCRKAIAAAFGEDYDGDKDGDGAGKMGGEKEPEKTESTRATDDGEMPKEKTESTRAAEYSDTEAKRASRTPVTAKVDSSKILASLGEIDKRTADLDKRTKAIEDREIEEERRTILASRPDLTESQKAYLKDKQPAEMREALAKLAPPPPNTKASAASQAGVRPTMGHSQNKNATGVRAAQLQGDERKEMLAKFGRVGQTATTHWEGNEFVLPILSEKTAREILARHANDYGSDATIPMRTSMPAFGAQLVDRLTPLVAGFERAKVQ